MQDEFRLLRMGERLRKLAPVYGEMAIEHAERGRSLQAGEAARLAATYALAWGACVRGAALITAYPEK